MGSVLVLRRPGVQESSESYNSWLSRHLDPGEVCTCFHVLLKLRMCKVGPGALVGNLFWNILFLLSRWLPAAPTIMRAIFFRRAQTYLKYSDEELGTSRLPHYCAPLVCVLNFQGGLVLIVFLSVYTPWAGLVQPHRTTRARVWHAASLAHLVWVGLFQYTKKSVKRVLAQIQAILSNLMSFSMIIFYDSENLRLFNMIKSSSLCQVTISLAPGLEALVDTYWAEPRLLKFLSQSHGFFHISFVLSKSSFKFLCVWRIPNLARFQKLFNLRTVLTSCY